jgi:6-phosphofructokinase 1
MTGLETRETILGYVQRGGSPSPQDRILATRYGAHAAELIHKKQFGTMVSLKNNQITSVPLDEVGGKLRLIEPTDNMIKKGLSLGICFGVE